MPLLIQSEARLIILIVLFIIIIIVLVLCCLKPLLKLELDQ